MTHDPQSTPRTDSESGFVLLAVLFLVVLLLISLAVAAPIIAKSIQRDKEQELVQRGEQYKRAIKLYYAKFGSYPTSVDQLINTNQIRYLRKRYTDPMTGKDDWKLVYFGQAHVQPMGLFGQPIAGVGGASQIPGATGVGTPIGGATAGSATGSTEGAGSDSGTASGSASGSGSLFDTPASGSSSGGSSFGSSSGGSSFGSSSGGSSFGSNSGAGGMGSSGIGGGIGAQAGTNSPTGMGAGSTPGSTSGSSGFGSSGSSGATMGGGPIVGVKIPSTKVSIKLYKKQKHYNEWEFVYNPLEEQLQAGGALGAGGQNMNGSNTNGFGTGTSFGPTSGSGTVLNSGQIGGTSTGPAPTPPQ